MHNDSVTIKLCLFLQYCNSNIIFFSLYWTVIAPNLLWFIFCFFPWFFSLDIHSLPISLLEAIVTIFPLLCRANTIERAIQKRSHEQMYFQSQSNLEKSLILRAYNLFNILVVPLFFCRLQLLFLQEQN